MAWDGFDASKSILEIADISSAISTNRVFRIAFDDGDAVIAKVSSFGKYESFKEDHRIIHSLSNNLLYPFDNLLAKSLIKNNRVYIYRFTQGRTDLWVVFYNPTRILNRLPKCLDNGQIQKLGQQIGKFHTACSRIKNVLPRSLKTLHTDIYDLQRQLELNKKQFGTKAQVDFLKQHCDLFLKNSLLLNLQSFEAIPVFMDWDTGNFSVGPDFELYSRWDYDWFRMSHRILDFYFLSRVVTNTSDQTLLSYDINSLMDERFVLFLKEYHKVNPITTDEIRFIKESYRFFILNYIIKDGRNLFKSPHAPKLRAEAFEVYLPSVDHSFDADKIIEALELK